MACPLPFAAVSFVAVRFLPCWTPLQNVWVLLTVLASQATVVLYVLVLVLTNLELVQFKRTSGIDSLVETLRGVDAEEDEDEDDAEWQANVFADSPADAEVCTEAFEACGAGLIHPHDFGRRRNPRT